MSEFLRRNKKKGLLAFLLLFFQRGKGIAPLLVILAAMSFIFLLPQGFVEKMPWISRVASRAQNNNRGDGTSMPWKTARSRRGSRDSVAGKNNQSYLFRKSAIGYVRGDDDLPGDGMYDSLIDDAGESVEGVLRPEDAKRMGDGVPLSHQDMINSFTGEGLNGMLGEGGLAALAQAQQGGGGFSVGARATDNSKDLMNEAMDQKRVPKVGRATSKRVPRGKISDRRFRGISARIGKGMSNARGKANSNMYQLVEARAYGLAAAPESVGEELASSAAGAVFDGHSADNDGLTATGGIGLGGGSSGGIGDIATLMDEASQLEEDAIACERAEDKYGDQEREHLAEIQRISDKMNGAACNSSGCGGNLDQCRALGDSMRVECRAYNDVSRKHTAECPLRSEFSEMDCEQ